PAGVIRPTWLPDNSTNQRLPSGPAVIPLGSLLAVARGNSVMVPVGVIRPTLLPSISVNHRLPSGPAAIPSGPLGSANAVIGTRGTSPTRTLLCTVMLAPPASVIVTVMSLGVAFSS